MFLLKLTSETNAQDFFFFQHGILDAYEEVGTLLKNVIGFKKKKRFLECLFAYCPLFMFFPYRVTDNKKNINPNNI